MIDFKKIRWSLICKIPLIVESYYVKPYSSLNELISSKKFNQIYFVKKLSKLGFTVNTSPVALNQQQINKFTLLKM